VTDRVGDLVHSFGCLGLWAFGVSQGWCLTVIMRWVTVVIMSTHDAPQALQFPPKAKLAGKNLEEDLVETAITLTTGSIV